jgi:hypothetical protein
MLSGDFSYEKMNLDRSFVVLRAAWLWLSTIQKVYSTPPMVLGGDPS